MQAGTRNVRTIFNRGRNLEIPFFQRAYVWKKDQWERFYEDMMFVSKMNGEYFLGSVILKQQGSGSDQDDLFTVIDGQQRLTTLNIFMKVVCLMKDDDVEFTNTFKKQRDKTIILLHNHNDIDSFNKIVGLEQLIDIENEEEDRIIECYTYFKNTINKDKIDLFNILDRLQFVGIDLMPKEDEQRIFDTINSLGVRLTTAELLKNYLFDRSELKLFEDYWRSVFELDADSKNYWDKEITTGRIRRSIIDLFLYSLLQIKLYDGTISIKSEELSKARKVENLFDSYKNLIEKGESSKLEILKEIKEYAVLFRENFDHHANYKEIESTPGINRICNIIFGLETTTLLPFSLFVLKNVTELSEQQKMFEFLEAYLMRRMITKDSSKNYNQLFTDRFISNKIKSKEELVNYIKDNDDQINKFPDNVSLLKGFNESKLTNKQAAGILYFLESRIRNSELQSTRLLGLSNYSLEHLMPKKWRNKWVGKSNKELEVSRDKKLLTLGNLTIITQRLNSSIRDSKWSVKKKGNKNNKGLMAYSSGIETLNDYLGNEEWTVGLISQRADDLYNKATEIWIK